MKLYTLNKENASDSDSLKILQEVFETGDCHYTNPFIETIDVIEDEVTKFFFDKRSKIYYSPYFYEGSHCFIGYYDGYFDEKEHGVICYSLEQLIEVVRKLYHDKISQLQIDIQLCENRIKYYEEEYKPINIEEENDETFEEFNIKTQSYVWAEKANIVTNKQKIRYCQKALDELFNKQVEN